MNIAFTSDIHSDITETNCALLPFLAAEVERRSPDVLVLGGDIANTLDGWRDALSAFQAVTAPRLIVPGNDDVTLLGDAGSEHEWQSQEEHGTTD